MIKAVELTLAPFTQREKPQLSPGLAASFIRNSRRISGLGMIGVGRCTAVTESEMTIAGRVMPIFIGLFTATRHCASAKPANPN
jgi:hypothetical protein